MAVACPKAKLLFDDIICDSQNMVIIEPIDRHDFSFFLQFGLCVNYKDPD